MTDCFNYYGWCTRIRGAESGGKVYGLPTYVFTTDDGDEAMQCPTEVAITDRREAELSDLGFLPVCHYKRTDYAVFFGAQTAQKAKKYEGPDGVQATENAAISARLPYVMATSRHRALPEGHGPRQDRQFHGAGRLREVAEHLDQELRAGRSARAARRTRRDCRLPTRGSTSARCPANRATTAPSPTCRPWLQLEALTASLRTVTRIPKQAK